MLTIPQQAGDDGRLFGSVTTQDIADAIRDARGLRIDRRKVHLDEPIRNVGTYMVVVEVADGVTATIKTMVVARTSAASARPPTGERTGPAANMAFVERIRPRDSAGARAAAAPAVDLEARAKSSLMSGNDASQRPRQT